MFSEIFAREGLTRDFQRKADVGQYYNALLLSRFSCRDLDTSMGCDFESDDIVPPFGTSFCTKSPDILAVSDEQGYIKLFNTAIEGCQNAVVQEWRAHTNTIFDISWVPGEGQLVTASGDQYAVLWDIEYLKSLAVFEGHTASLKSVSVMETCTAVLATGGRDGLILIWDTRVNNKRGFYRPVNIIRPKRISNSQQKYKNVKGYKKLSTCIHYSVTAVVSQDSHTIISSDDVSCDIKVWDLRKSYSHLNSDPIPKHVFEYQGSNKKRLSYSSLVLDSTKSRLFANGTDHKIYQYDCINFNNTPVCYYSGHSNYTFYVRAALSCDDSLLLSGSSDYNAPIWQVERPSLPAVQLCGHDGEVTSVAWSPVDNNKIATCSDDGVLMVWRLLYTECYNKHNRTTSSADENYTVKGVSRLYNTTDQKSSSVGTHSRMLSRRRMSHSRSKFNIINENSSVSVGSQGDSGSGRLTPGISGAGRISDGNEHHNTGSYEDLIQPSLLKTTALDAGLSAFSELDDIMLSDVVSRVCTESTTKMIHTEVSYIHAPTRNLPNLTDGYRTCHRPQKHPTAPHNSSRQTMKILPLGATRRDESSKENVETAVNRGKRGLKSTPVRQGTTPRTKSSNKQLKNQRSIKTFFKPLSASDENSEILETKEILN